MFPAGDRATIPLMDLPVLAREPVCPAALSIAGACRSQQGVVCRLMQQSQEDDPGVGMSAGQLGTLREGAGGVYLNLKSDPSSVTAFCHGDAIPVLTDADGQGRASYTFCPTWQAARDRRLAGEDGLYEDAEPESVSMGVSSDDAPDPWKAAREGLDELAPAQQGDLVRALEDDPRTLDLLRVAGRL